MENQEKKKRVRSPNYPCVSLNNALDLAEKLYSIQKQYWVPLEIAAKDWNFSSGKSGYLAQHIAALASYGLIDVEGEKETRKIKISDAAMKIIIDKRPSSEDRAKLIKEAALSPNIFKKMYDIYPVELPPDHTLEYELITKYEFNASSVKNFISILKQTFDYAGVYKSCIIGEENKPIEETDMPNLDTQSIKDRQPGGIILPSIIKTNEREIATYTIGRGLKARIIISGDQPTTIKSIEKLLKRLEEDKEDLLESIVDEKTETTEN